MRLSFALVTFPALLLLNHVAALNDDYTASTHNRLRKRIPKPKELIACNLFSIHRIPLPNTPDIEPSLCCVMNNGKALAVKNMSKNFFKGNPFRSGKTLLSFSASMIKTQTSMLKTGDEYLHDVIDMSAGSAMIISDDTSNNIRARSFSQDSAREGDYHLAVIRVTGKDGYTPGDNALQISENIFGTSGDTTLNMVVGYKNCSGNKVNFIKATGNEFENGVMDLTISQNVSGRLAQDVENDVTDKLLKMGFDSSTYDNIMYILPDEVNFEGAAAYAYLNGHLSIFSNHWASKQYVLMHEIGHNLGHHHSGQQIKAYGDDTGMMGTQEYADNSPRACFNAAKSWWSTWYSDLHIEIAPTSGSMVLNMVGIDDYLQGQATRGAHNTVARISGPNETDLYVMYNRAEGVNSEVLGHRDEVTIVQQNGKARQSWLKAGLSLDNGVESQWTKHNWNGSNNTLVVQVCDMIMGTPDYARVIVYLQGVNDVSCSTLPTTTGCPPGESKFKAVVMTDAQNKETKWWLKKRNARNIFRKKVLKQNRFKRNSYSEKEKCIDNSKCYKFKIRDTARNGIIDGSYEISFNGHIIKNSTFANKAHESTKFGAC